MVNSKRLLEMARKWQKLAVLGRRRISWGRTNSSPKSDAISTSVAEKGHFVVYSEEGRRFMVPLANLGTGIFVELFKMAQEEFGLPGDGPIVLPCDAASLESVLYFLRKQVDKDLETALLTSISNDRCCSSSSFHSLRHNGQSAVCSF